jgi:O-antigen/teichoic acid export membrane protein
MSLARTVARNSLWSGLDMVVDVVFPPLASILVARAMGPAKLGAFTYVMWVSATTTALGGNGLLSAARRYMADRAGKRQPDVVRALLRTCLKTQLFILSLLTLAGLAWAQWFLPADEKLFASLALLAVLPGGSMSMATAVNMAFQEVRPNVVASVCSALVHAAGMVLVVVMGWGLVGLAAAYLASRLCDCLVRWGLTASSLPGYLSALGPDPTPPGTVPKLPPGFGRELAVFVVESTILTLLTLVVWNRSEIFFLKRYSAIEQVAYFSVAFGLSQIPGQGVGPFSRAASVSVYAEHGRDAQTGLRVAQVYWRYVTLLVLPACFGLAVLSTPLLHLLYGPRYAAAGPVLILGASLGMFAPLVEPAVSLVTASGGQRRLVIAGMCAAIATLSLDFVLVRAFAAIGGALANGLGQAISAVTVTLIARRYSFKIPLSFFFRVLGAVAGMVVAVLPLVLFLPELAAVALGIPLGVLAYGFSLRIGRIVDVRDVERFLHAEILLPRRLRPLFRRLLYSVASPSVPVG